MRLIMENFRRYLLTEAAKGLEDLPKNIYVTIREDDDSTTVHYSDYLGRRLATKKRALWLRRDPACLRSHSPVLLGSIYGNRFVGDPRLGSNAL